MSSLRVMIADDEAPARRKLARFLTAHADVELIAEASNGVDAVDLVAMTKPDLLFLDIHMPDLDGLGVAEALLAGEAPPQIVFVTAYDRYAVRAFEIAALDYLLKPFDEARFERALQRARDVRAVNGDASHALATALTQARHEEAYVHRLLLPNDGRSFFVAVRDIARFDARDDRVIAHVREGEYPLRTSLEALEARLDPAHFARVHRSHVINIDWINEIAPWFHGDYKLTLRDGTELTWSRRYAAKRPDLLK